MGGGGAKKKLGDTKIYAGADSLSNPNSWNNLDDFDEAAEIVNELSITSQQKKLIKILDAYDKADTIVPDELRKYDEFINRRLSGGDGIVLPKDITVSVKGTEYKNFKVGESINAKAIVGEHKGAIVTHNQVSGATQGSVVFRLSIPKGYNRGSFTRSRISEFEMRGHAAAPVRIKDATLGGSFILSNNIKGKITSVQKSSKGATIVYVKVDK